MFCRRCRLHFSASRTDGRCPNCGQSGETTPAEGILPDDPARTHLSRYSLNESSPSVQETVASNQESSNLTRTDHSAPNVWGKGTVVAGKYEILRKIGTGGFGSVYKVRHIHRKKLYALKTPHPEFLRDETFQKRFEREIEAMERFVHPDMVIVRDSGITESGIPYYTMDFIEGESLREVMSREGPLDIRRAVNIIRRILQVLEVAHKNQIIHRDIKPDNILLTKKGGREVVKVLDFGVAKLLNLIGSTGTITHGMRVGTPKYMSPEQVTGDEVDGRSDLFAVGILLYEALTGVHPFAVDQDPIRTTGAILSKEPEAPQKRRPEIPKNLSDRIMQLIEKKPRRRPQSAAAILDSLPEVESTRSRSVARVESLNFIEDAPRQKVSSLVFTRETSAGMQRFFFFFKNVVTFGRSNDPRTGMFNDLILRRLPCRSQHEDPDNWNLNLTISHRVAQISVEKSAVVIEPWPESRSGITVGGLRSREPVRIQSDRFHLSLGDRALELDGYRVLKDSSRTPLDLSFIPNLEESDRESDGHIGYTNPHCLVNCLRLTRNNYPLHQYYLVYRRLAMGSGAGADLRIPAEHGVEGHHASFIYDHGELFVIPVGGEVRIKPAAVKDVEGTWSGSRAEMVLNPGDVYPVIEGMSMALGSVTLRVHTVEESMFKKV